MAQKIESGPLSCAFSHFFFSSNLVSSLLLSLCFLHRIILRAFDRAFENAKTCLALILGFWAGFELIGL